MINVGIIGTGVMGAGHARFIKEHVPDATVVGLSDIDLNKINLDSITCVNKSETDCDKNYLCQLSVSKKCMFKIQ